ncbi:translocation/assembly module TamB [Orbaceae bacterium ESL0721]|nr:translocation/assembly module TamB [Orbaceae bacterium ESL0721]
MNQESSQYEGSLNKSFLNKSSLNKSSLNKSPLNKSSLNKSPKKSGQPKKHRRLGRGILITLSIIILLITLLFSLFYTSLGLNLTQYAVEKFLPELKIAKIKGSLHHLTLKGFDLELEGVSVKIDNAELSISGLSLLKAQLNITQFNANDISVVVNTNEISPSESESEPESESKPSERFVIKMPIPIYLGETHLTKVNVMVDDMQFGMSDFTGKAKWEKEKLHVYPAVAKDLTAIFADDSADHKSIQSKPHAVLTDQNSLNQQINQLFNQPLIASLPQISLPLDINVESLTGSNWFLHIAGDDYRFKNNFIQTNIIDNHIQVAKVETDATTPFATGHAIVSGDIILGDTWPLSADINITTDQDRLIGQFSGNLLGELNSHIKISGVNQADLNASINFIKNYMPLKIALQGQYLQWPLSLHPQYQLSNFAVNSSGTLQQYQIAAKGQFKGEGLPDTQFDIAGSGTSEKAYFDHAIAKFPQGEVDITGQLSWIDTVDWDLLVKIDHVDLIKELPSYPIKLNGEIATKGSFGNNKNSDNKDLISNYAWQFELSKLQLNGNIKQADFTATGGLTANSNNLITANNLLFSWGKNSLNLNGSTENSNLTANLNLKDLSLFMDELQGTVNGQIKMSGKVKSTTFDSNIAINQFTWQDIAIDRANISSRLHYQQILSGNLSFTGESIDLATLSIKNADIKLTGSEDHHVLTVNIDGQPLSLISTLTGHIDPDRKKWDGTFTQTSLHTEIADNNTIKSRWNLTNSLPVTYNLAKESFTIGAHCWVGSTTQNSSNMQNSSTSSSSSSICLEKPYTNTANSATTINLNNIDLATLPIPNDGETKLAGNLSGKATIRSLPNSKIPTIKLVLDSSNVFIKQTLASQILPIPFDRFSIDFDLNESRAKLSWNFGLNQFGKINGNVIITDPLNNRGIKGELVIDNLALALINPLLKTDEYAKGVIDGNLKFSGTLFDPTITGKINLQQSEIKSSQLPVDINSVAIDIYFKGKSSTLDGVIVTKNGNLNIKGQASWRTINNWHALLTLTGSAIKVTVPPMVVLSVIPDIRLEASEKGISLTGKIEVPKGKITVETLPPSIIDVSSDEVMLDKNLQPVPSSNVGLNINTDLTITIDDKVKVDAFGLKASLAGNLRILQDNQGLGVFGQILIPDGRFLAYGQDLVIRKGEITFAGPTDKAVLNVEAIRNPDAIEDQVTAGIRVTGIIDDPKIEIFSDPAMSQQEALSYLLRGQGLESGEENDNDMMTAMLVGLGTAKSGKFISNVGNLFGIKNLTLDTQGAGNSSKVVVSGYILPDLQLKYGVGIFDAIATFTLRYRLMPKLYLEATSGLAQTLDLIYQLEF